MVLSLQDSNASFVLCPMDAERWQKLKKIYEAALEQEHSDRPSFIEKACGNDSSLRKEVEALLESRNDGFLEQPAYEAAPELLESEAEDRLIGRQIGSYLVTGKLGSGGMGVVYKADDA